jgi:hypothetical protein
VDAGLSPQGSLQRPPGVPQAVMAAHPAEGGMGLLPWAEHVTARWAVQGVQLLEGSSDTPWVALARTLLQRHSPQWRARLQAGLPLAGGVGGGGGARLPAVLDRMVSALRALPPLQNVAPPILPDRWCWAAPLWGNPCFYSQPHQRQQPPLEECFSMLVGKPGMQTLGDAAWALQLVKDAEAVGGDLADRRRAYAQTAWPLLGNLAHYADRQLARQHLEQMCDAAPPTWMHYVQEVLQEVRRGDRPPGSTPAERAAARQRALGGAVLGWVNHAGERVPLAQLTVRAATQLQLGPTRGHLQQRHAAFAQRALAGQPPPAEPPAIGDTLRRLWRLRCCNKFKVAYWRLTLNAFPTASRMGDAAAARACAAGCPAPVGTVGLGVEHHFWDCGVAVAVRGEVARQLQLPGPLLRSALWLCERPALSVHAGVWDVVCLAAVHAMEVGRKRAWAVRAAPPGG